MQSLDNSTVETVEIYEDFDSIGIVAPSESSRSFQTGRLGLRQFMSLYPTLDEDSVKKVIEAVKCLIEIYHLFGLNRVKDTSSHTEWLRYNNSISNSCLRCLDFMKLQGSNSWMSYFKYKTCAFYSFFENQDLPPKPVGLSEADKPNVLFGGYILNFQKILKNKNNVKFQSFILTINMAKMGMPRANPNMVKEAAYKTAVHLTTEPPPIIKMCNACGLSNQSNYHCSICEPSLTLSEFGLTGLPVYLNKEALCEQMKRTVRELYKDKVYRNEDHYEPFFPSTSANYYQSRNHGGAVTTISNIISKFYNLPFIGRDDKTEFLKFDEIDVVSSGQISSQYGDEGWVKQILYDVDALCGKEHETRALQYDATVLKSRWREIFDYIGESAFAEDPLVETVGLVEALKIRVISKGPPLTYTFLSPLQKFLWKILKNNRVFRMISTPLTEEFVQERIGIPTNEDIIINGDYKASTDNLHSWISECIGRELIKVLNENSPEGEFKFSDNHTDLFIRSLINHKFKIDEMILPQREGQLMGSVTSFPILCIANAAMCRWSLELSNNIRYRLSDSCIEERSLIAPLLINGDDCTLRGNRSSLRSIWERITSYGGLTSSVGKTLFSLKEKPIVVLNSTTYHLQDGLWKEIKFVNMGIMLGKARSQINDSSDRTYDQLGALHKELLESSPEVVREDVINRFIYFNKKTLTKCPNIPWDMPAYLGGPGLVRKNPSSDFDRRCATLIIARKDIDNRYKIEQPKKVTFWKIHEAVVERLASLSNTISCNFRQFRKIISEDLFDPENFILYNTESEHQKLYKYLCVEQLMRFSHEVHFSKYVRKNALKPFDPNTKVILATDINRINEGIFKRNCSAWSNASKECYDYPLIVRSDEEIDFERKDFYIQCIPV